jgi:hypothetical protein
VERVVHGDLELAIILRVDFKTEGIRFFTPDGYSQQLAYMSHPKGHAVAPHEHLAVPRQIEWTREVLVVRRGRLRVDFYSGLGEYFESRILAAGDVILLAHGGHGFEMLEDCEMIEIKQGPYVGTDKRRFGPVPPDKIVLPEGQP